MEQTTPVGRNVQQQVRTATYRFEIKIEQFIRSLDQRILSFMPKPAGTYRYIALGRHPVRTMPMARSGLVTPGIARHTRAATRAGRVEGGPARIACDPFFVAHPANIRASIA